MLRPQLSEEMLDDQMLKPQLQEPPIGDDEFILLESGDFFLLETGDKLIKE